MDAKLAKSAGIALLSGKVVVSTINSKSETQTQVRAGL